MAIGKLMEKDCIVHSVERTIRMGMTVLWVMPIILFASCESKFDKKMRRTVEQINAALPAQANDWMWKDSVSYQPQERTLCHYFSFRVNGAQKELVRQVYRNKSLANILLCTEDMTIYLENDISMRVVGLFEDGEVISDITITPTEMKDNSRRTIAHRDLTEYIYANLAVSMNVLCPYRIDKCTTITQSDFDRDNMEFILYWDVDEACMPFPTKQDIRDAMRGYIVELIKHNHRNILELEKHTTLSTYKRSDFPVKVTIVCNGDNGFSATESVLSSDVDIN